MGGGGAHGCDFYDVICINNLYSAWKEFSKGKRSKEDVANFELNLENNLFKLHEDLISNLWQPDSYVSFFVQDPKVRKIHKASVRDRVLYQALCRSLYQVFDSSFIYDIYSSINYKGTHAGVIRLEELSRKISSNHIRPGFVLKCDIRKFFDSIDHEILFDLISKKVRNKKLLHLIWQTIDSFHYTKGKGLPLGNVTSQLFANIYMNKFDQFIKHTIKAKYYIRYCDDFIILHKSKDFLESLVFIIFDFLLRELKIELHPRKVEIRKIIQGVDFLGYVVKPNYRVLRTNTKNRIISKLEKSKNLLDLDLISNKKFDAILASYLGVLSHCRSRYIKDKIEDIISQTLQLTHQTHKKIEQDHRNCRWFCLFQFLRHQF